MMRLLIIAFSLLITFDVNASETDISLLSNYGFYASWKSEQSTETFDVSHQNSFALKNVWRSAGEYAWEIYFSEQQVKLKQLEFKTINNLAHFELKSLQLGALKENPFSWGSEYYGAGVGVTRFTARADELNPSENISLSFFGGLQMKITQHFLLSFEGRMQLHLLDSMTSVNCSPECDIDIKSQTWSSLQIGAGLTYRF
ncbi:hypothetical protein [Aliikangiella sp. IMCC44359]|uniref:hypothetical protein n=1 Tax=Aliikangiella sp. IMCC44359 TaxID=3459125 RepID=UPI00403B2B12